MAEYQRLTEYTFPKAFLRPTKEASFWKSFDTKLVIKENGPINQIAICPADRPDFAVCSSYKVDAYCSKSFTLKKSFTKFKENPHAAAFRSDGKVLVAGDASGLIQVFDYETKNVLRELRKHTGIVRGVGFGNSKTDLFSVSDDKSLRLWDVAVGEEKSCFLGHDDYIRALCVSTNSLNIVATGGYDHTVRVWDVRSRNSVVFDHEHPVEAVTLLSGGSMLASCGGNAIKIWDLVANRLVANILNHQKTVTCLSFDEESNRLFAGSLDRQIKVMDAASYKVIFGVKFPSALISMGICSRQNYMVAGFNNGTFMVKSNDSLTAQSVDGSNASASQELKHQSGFATSPWLPKRQDSEKIVISAQERKQLSTFDRLLKKFRHAEALSVAFETGNPQIVVVMLEELHRRGALESALGCRDEEFVQNAAEFAAIHIKNPNYSLILTEMINILFSTYSPLLGRSPSIDEAFTNLAQKVKEELNFQIELQKLTSVLNIVLSSHGIN